jgi:hypothetical protein
MRVRLRLPFVLAGLLACASALAGTPAEEAKELFVKGREAMKRGDNLAALALFESSQRAFPAPGTLTNMALVEEQLGRLASAWRHFGEVAAGLPANDPRAEVARQHLSSLETRLPRLRVDRAPGAPASMVVKLDGVDVAADALGRDQPVDPGRHVVVASAPGVAGERRFEATLSEGQRAVLAVEPPAAAPPPAPPPPVASARAPVAPPAASSSAPVAPPPPPAASAPGSGQRVVGYSFIGLGVVGVGVGAVMGALTLGKKTDVEQCMSDAACLPQTGRDAESSGRTFGAVSTVGFVAGGLLAAGGVVLVLTAPKAATTGATLAPLALPGGGGAALGGRF